MLFCSYITLAQNTPNKFRTDLLAPSPTAANLSKYGNVPVTLYTGSANTSIPIFTVEGNDIELPITLTYNYNGLKPNEQVSWIGLGWSLQAGGVITRNIRGRSDDDAIPSNRKYDVIFNNIGSMAESDQNFLKSTAESMAYDTEPDLFSYSFAGYSGKFVKVNGQVYTFPVSKLKIEGSGSTGFTVTTENGDKYYFAMAEYTRPKNAAGSSYNMGTYASAWYLTKITNAANTESINLSYEDEQEMTQEGYRTQTLVKANDFTQPTTLGDITSPMPTFVSPVRLSQITSDKFTVIFYQEVQARQDIKLSSSYALNSIVINNRSGTTLKQFKFEHEYFGTINFPDNKYLKLKSLKQFDAYPSDVPGIGSPYTDSLCHKFEYINEFSSFPSKTTIGIDHYGYAQSGEGGALIPATVDLGDHIEDVYISGGNREPDSAAAIVGSLRKIVYPTGGATTFSYERNRMAASGFKSKSLSVSLNVQRPNPNTTDIINQSGTFHINEPQLVQAYGGRTPKHAVSGAAAKDNILGELSIWKDGDAPAGNLKVVDNNTQSVSVGLQLDTGTYTYTVTCDGSENYASGGIVFYERTNIPNFLVGPGFRIRSMVDSSVVGNPVVKVYSYQDGSGAFPSYGGTGYTETTINQTNPNNPYTTTYGFSVISSVSSQQENQGLPYFYPIVTEDTGKGNTVTRTVYKFKNLEYSAQFAGATLINQVDYKKVGNDFVPLKEKSFTYNFISDGQYGFLAIRPYMQTKTVITGSNLGNGTLAYGYTGYTMNAAWNELQSVKEVLYDGDTLITETKNLYNRSTHNIAVSRTVNSRGETTVQKNKYPEDYTTSVSGNLVAANVIAPAIESQVWNKRSATDSVLVSGMITKYDSVLFKPVAKYVLESSTPLASLDSEGKDGNNKYASLLSDTRYKPRYSFKYDAFARLISQNATGGIINSYLWAYKGDATQPLKFNYPVAEIKNALPTEFYYQNFEEASGATTGTANTGIKFNNGAYTVTWTRPNGRAYLISYWYRSGGIWKLKAPQSYTTTSLALSGGDAYDDVLIYPADAQITTYAYYPGTGFSAVTDPKGLTSYYEYDKFQRPRNIKDKDGNILQNYSYNYVNPPLPVIPNEAQSGAFTKSCTTGVGSSVTYTVPAGTYTAATQAQANALALADVNANGQAYANTNGTCQMVPFIKMEITSSYLGADNHNYNVYTFKSFADQAGTIPYNVPASLTINYYRVQNTSVNGGSPTSLGYYETVTMASGANTKNLTYDVNTCGTMIANIVAGPPASESAKSGTTTQQSTAGGGASTNAVPPGGGGSTTCITNSITLQTGTGYILFVNTPQ